MTLKLESKRNALCFLIIMLLILPSISFSQTSNNVTEVGQIAPVGTGTSFYQDVWGTVDKSTGIEYGLITSFQGVILIDLSEPSTPLEVSRMGNIRGDFDVKAFGHYVVSGVGEIFDISNVSNPVLISTFGGAHNLYVDYPFLYTACPNNIYDISDPYNPLLIANYGGGCHDLVVMNDTAYVASGWINTRILDVSNKYNILTMSEFDLPDDYSHFVFPTRDRQHLFLTDEVGSWGTTVWDISDYDNVSMVSQFTIHSLSTTHNLFIKENYAYISHYTDGLRILEISDPTNVSEAGFFYTNSPPDTLNRFNSNWGVYPYAPSGLIYLSDRSNGFFVVDFDSSNSLAGIFTTVKDASDNTPINHAWSKIEGYFTGVTDSLGESLFYAPEDNYNIITNKFGYYPDTTNLTLIKDGMINLDVLLEPAIPELTLNAILIDFDSLNIQSASLDSLYISNNGYTVLHLEIETSNISGFNIESPAGTILRPGDEVLMRIFFIPSEAIDYEGTILITSEAGSDTVYLSGTGTSIGIEDDPNLLPEKITLYQNYPNPFNPTTIIKYDLTEFSNVKLSIYDINGNLVQTLLNSKMPAGKYEIEWNAAGVASGIYIYSIESGNAVLNKKLILLK